MSILKINYSSFRGPSQRVELTSLSKKDTRNDDELEKFLHMPPVSHVVITARVEVK